jgi:hypothetical protein
MRIKETIKGEREVGMEVRKWIEGEEGRGVDLTHLGHLDWHHSLGGTLPQQRDQIWG